MSILPHDALAVDVYPDESPELPISAYFEPEPHAETCTLLEPEPAASDPATWSAWTDAFVWEPVESALPLDEQVAREAERYKRQDTVLGSFLHAELLALAYEIRSLKAGSPVEFEGRREVMERGRIDDIEERAYQEGLIAGREQCPRCGRLD